ncbi:MAG: hypothetical protein PHF50_04295 [Patescibacteria group bacterium]|nr:hypothetical protein [Patescibacteria group bacterium]
MIIDNNTLKEAQIGFIGQGWIGKNYADDFEARGYKTVRYGLEPEYAGNKEKIKGCDMVFIAVPTPTTPQGFNCDILRGVIKLVGQGKIAVIKSTILPGTTEAIQKENPEIYVLHSPEFLSRATAVKDTTNPDRNIIGAPLDNEEYRSKAEQVMSVLPEAPFKLICSAKEAELIKYARNCQGYFRVIFANLAYNLSKAIGADWQKIEDAMAADPVNGGYYFKPVHSSGRGAGGPCYLKDFAAFAKFYKEKAGDDTGQKIIELIQKKNLELLTESKKDLDILKSIFGDDIIKE